LPSDDPLLSAPNLILTPHCAGYSEESLAEVKQLACEAACRILSGRWPRWVVNPKVKPKFELVDEGQV
jgi:D-3-phosphoglycerate dehydrogenase